jgi:P-type Cu+ transporter
VATDPVCGMWVEEGPNALRLMREGRTYFFCCASCLDQFAEPVAAQRRLGRRLAVVWPCAVLVAFLTYAVGTGVALYVAAGLATVVQVYGGWPFFRGTRDAITDRSWNMDVLIAVGSSAAFGYSVAALALPGRLPPHYYFDASALIIALILTGNYLEHLVRARSGSALRALDRLFPPTAELLRDGAQHPVPVNEVRPGDRLLVRPGARFPVDGVVRGGTTTADESLLTGESAPVLKQAGDRVIATSGNGSGAVEVEATAVASDTFAAQVGRLLSDAEMGRVPLQRLADRIASRFVPFVLAVAVIAGLGWYLVAGAGPTVGVLVFVTVVIIACPCAFGIATPAALMVGSGRAAERGILFRGGDSIERAAEVDLVLTDKTGTLTEARPELTDLWTVAGVTEAELIALAAAVEVVSEHPLGAAVVLAARQRSLVPPSARNVEGHAGVGIEGEVGGTTIWVGRPEPSDLAPGAPARSRIEALSSGGRSTAVVRQDGRTLGVLGFSDRIRAEAAESVRALAADGIPTVMATGDTPAAAALVARTVGISEVHAGLDPAGKLALLRELTSEGHRVAAVGDGVNDAPILAGAHLGIAIGSGTDVAREAGHVLLTGSDFSGVPMALRLGRRTVAKVRANLAWAIGYNAVLLPIAAGALVPLLGLGVYGVLPILGAAAMAVSSTLVVTNSLSLRWVSLGARGRDTGA